MRRIGRKLIYCVFLWLLAATSYGTNLDTIGVTLLRSINPAITGAGIQIAQVEVPETPPLAFEVNPAAVGQPVSLFTWYSTAGSASIYPNAVGTESGHADGVGNIFYGASAGAAPGLSHVDNYEANYFVNSIVTAASPPTIPAKVVNQSFVASLSSEQTLNTAYDNYAANKNVLFVSGAGNSGAPQPPSTAFNSISVGAYGGGSAVGPASDGRCKPDITAPAAATSFSTPLVAAAAALLMQSADDGAVGTNTPAAKDLRTLKALLLNGAVKLSDWTNSTSHPLDFRYGAGMLNVFNSYKQLGAGRFSAVEVTSNQAGSSHFPGTNPANVLSLAGWDFASLTNQGNGPNTQERASHYYFDLTQAARFTLTATLTWNRQVSQTTINDLDLFLYNCANSNLVTCSTSAIDNVEHLYVPTLPAGRYDLQVLKRIPGVSSTETYALAFEIFETPLSIANSGTNAVISWPVYPDGFVLETRSVLEITGAWSTITNTPVITNNLNRVTIPASGTAFYRLRRS